MTMDQIQLCKECVSFATGVTAQEMSGTSRLRHLVDARRMCFALLREEFGMTYKQIGKAFGKNHATIIHSVRVHKTILDYDKEYQIKYHLAKMNLNDDDSVQLINSYKEKLNEARVILKQLKNEGVYQTA